MAIFSASGMQRKSKEKRNRPGGGSKPPETVRWGISAIRQQGGRGASYFFDYNAEKAAKEAIDKILQE